MSLPLALVLALSTQFPAQQGTAELPVSRAVAERVARPEVKVIDRLPAYAAAVAEYDRPGATIDELDLAMLMAEYSRLLVNYEQFDRARPYLERAVAIMRRRLPPTDLRLLAAEQRWSGMLYASGQRDESDALLLDMIDRYEQSGNGRTAGASAAHAMLGERWFRQGRYAQALPHLEKARIADVASGQTGDRQARLWSQTAHAQFALGQISLAKASALESLKAEGPRGSAPISAEQVRTRVLLARIFGLEGDVEEAEGWLVAVVAALRLKHQVSFMPPTPKQTPVLAELGWVQLQMRRDASIARATFRYAASAMTARTKEFSEAERGTFNVGRRAFTGIVASDWQLSALPAGRP